MSRPFSASSSNSCHRLDTDITSGSDLEGKTSRRWEDMDKDCLVNIFSRVPTPDLLVCVPCVCKTWHQASLDARCWRRLDFRSIEDASFSRLLEISASRSQGHATVLQMPTKKWDFDDCFEPEDMDFIANSLKCLQILICGRVKIKATQLRLAQAIGGWTDLVGFSIGADQHHLAETLAAVASGCPRFEQLHLFDMFIPHEAAAVIAEGLGPKITLLSLMSVDVQKEDLLLVLRACKGLRTVHIKECGGFKSDDPDILGCATAVPDFVYKPLKRNSFYSDYNLSMSDVYDGNSDDGYEL